MVAEKGLDINNLPENLKKVIQRAVETFSRLQHATGTTILSFRVPVQTKFKYEFLNPESKRAIRQTIIQMVDKLFDGVVSQEPNINVNININLVRAEARAHVDVKVNVNELMDAVRELRKIVEQWKNYNVLPPAAISRIMKPIEKIEKLVVTN